MSFDDNLAFGRKGERLVFSLLREQGYSIIPSFEFSGKNEDKAPKLYALNEDLVLPDLDVCKGGDRFWVEVKTYTQPAFNRNRGCFVHAIQRNHYEQYLAVEKTTKCRVFIYVLEVKSGELRSVELSKAPNFPCQCSNCVSGFPTECSMNERVGVRQGVYWNRDTTMVKIHTFSDDEMVSLRNIF
jgi:hypothetical protein